MLKVLPIGILAVSLLQGASWPQAWNWWRGEDAYYERQYPKAAEFYGQAGAVESDPKLQSQMALNRGDALYRDGKFAEAEGAFTQAAGLDPENWRALYNQGNALFYQDDLLGAIASYEAALAIEPDDDDTKHNLEYVKSLLVEEEREQNEEQKSESQEGEDQEQQQSEQGGDEEQDDQNQSEEGDSEEESGDSDSEGAEESDTQEGDQSDESGENEESGNQGDDPQQQEGGAGDQSGTQQGVGREEDGTNLPDWSYSQRILEALRREESAYQEYRSMQQGEQEGDALDELWNNLFKDPSSVFFGSEGRSRNEPNDGVDW